MPWKTVWSAEGDELQRYDDAESFGGPRRLRRWMKHRERVLKKYVDATGLAAVFIPLPGIDPQEVDGCLTDLTQTYRFVLQQYVAPKRRVRLPEPGEKRRKPSRAEKKAK